MDRRPLVIIVCSWILGTSILSLCQGIEVFIALTALLLLLLGFSLAGKISPKLTFFCSLALLLSCGERYWIEQNNRSELELSIAEIGAEAELSGVVASIIEVDGDKVTFRLKSDAIQLAGVGSRQPLSENILVRIKLSAQEEQAVVAGWRRGDRITVRGALELPGEAGNFGAFDYRNYLMKQGIHWQLSAKGITSVESMETATRLLTKPLNVLDDLRLAIGSLMDRLYPSGDAGYMKGLVVGIRSDLDPEQFDNFARLGLTHVLAISGLHVGVVVYILLQIGVLMRLTRERTLAITIAMMPVYMLITGASPSAVRACLMAMIALWLVRRNALKDGLHLLFAAAMLMLIWNPNLIENVSFQLSFIVTAGLILFVPIVAESLPIRWSWLKGAVAVTVTAQVVSFPVTVYYFHAVHLLSLPANFLLVPFISFVVMPLGMVSIVLGAMWLPLGIIPAKLATWGNQFTFQIVDGLNEFVGLRMVWPQPSLLWVVVAYLLMGAGSIGLKRRLTRKIEQQWWDNQAVQEMSDPMVDDQTAPLANSPSLGLQSRRRRSVILTCTVALIGLSWLLWGYQPAWLNHKATVSFLNVGQGDSILIRTGEGKHILIDAGGTVSFRKASDEWRNSSDPYEVGRKLLVPLLLKRGIRQLDALVLTHMDADHIGGAQAVLDNIPVRALLFNGSIKDSPGVLSILQSAMDKSIPSYGVHAPLQWEIDRSTTIDVLYPAQEQSVEHAVMVEDDQNERSVVILLTVYGRNFLMPGDLETAGEQEVIEAQIASGRKTMEPPIDVLKVGHHGSKTSTIQPWVDFWKPREAVISVGKNNVYGHPNGGVLERLSRAGSQIWRTDIHGEIQYRISKDGSMSRRVLQDAGEIK